VWQAVQHFSASMDRGWLEQISRVRGDDTLSVAVLGTSQDAASRQSLVTAFNKKHPDIPVRIQGIQGADWADFFAKILTMVAAGTPPDVVVVATEGAQLFADRLAEPLDAYVQRDQSELQDYFSDVHPSLIEAFIHKGQLFQLPIDFNAANMYFNVGALQWSMLPCTRTRVPGTGRCSTTLSTSCPPHPSRRHPSRLRSRLPYSKTSLVRSQARRVRSRTGDGSPGRGPQRGIGDSLMTTTIPRTTPETTQTDSSPHSTRRNPRVANPAGLRSPMVIRTVSS